MSQFNIGKAKANLSSLVKKAVQCEEIIIAKDTKPLHRLSPTFPDQPKRPQPGTGKHRVMYIADDFAAKPKLFERYR